MSQSLVIRPELPEDVEVISHVTRLAFRAEPHSTHTEELVIEGLRRGGALFVSLVAQLDARVIGHIAFSPVEISDGSEHWYGLGPVSVVPELQGQGVGQALVRAGLSALKSLGAEGCVVVGEPTFYGRFGFASDPECVLAGVPQEYFQTLSLGERSAVGEVTYHEAFSARG